MRIRIIPVILGAVLLLSACSTSQVNPDTAASYQDNQTAASATK